MKWLLSARPSAADGPVGVIAVPRRGADRRVIAARVKALARELQKAGIDDVVCVRPGLGWAREMGDVDVPSLPLRSLERYVSNRPALFVSQEQYHLPHEWASDLLRKAVASDLSHHPDGIHESPMMSHLRIFAAFIATPASASRRAAAKLRTGKLQLSTPAESLEAVGLPSRRVKVTPQNIPPMYRQAVSMDQPYGFVIETNNSCNYHCIMCPYHGGRQGDKATFLKPGTYVDMPFEMFKNIVDQIEEIDRPYEDDTVITVTPYRRGEFLLYPYWREAIRYIKSKGYRVYFSTNASTWKDEDIDFAIEHELDHLQVSLNGHNMDIHRRLRLNDGFDQVSSTALKIIRRREELGKRKPYLQLCNTVNERNIQWVESYIETWVNKVDALMLSPENYPDDNYNKRYKVEFSPFPPAPAGQRPPCSMLKDMMWVNSDGKCILCIGKKLLEIGDLRTSTLNDLLKATTRVKTIMDHSNGRYDNPVCGNCDQWQNTHTEIVETDRYTVSNSAAVQYYTNKKPLEIHY
jgi:hypothetical protein